MVITADRLSLNEYLQHTDGSDRRFELFNGTLIPMAQPKGRHGAIAEVLNDIFRQEIRQDQKDWVAKHSLIALQSPQRGRWDTVRIPDVTVLHREQWQNLLETEAIIRLSDPPPILVVEIISESTRKVDYATKRLEYNLLEIQEYWIVDLPEDCLTILSLPQNGGSDLDQDLYQEQVFRGNDSIVSPSFPRLDLTVTQLWHLSLAA